MKPPGSRGERKLQKELATTKEALAFYNKRMLDHLNPTMKDFVSNQEIVFIATSDAKGECDCSFRNGPPGWVRVIDEKTLTYPEYRGNGVFASMGNILENPHIGMIFVDFFESSVGLHVNGKARVFKDQKLLKNGPFPDAPGKNVSGKGGPKAECWVIVEVEEAYIHCSKHIPRLKNMNKEIHWGTNKEIHKGGDKFKAEAGSRPWDKEK